MFYICALVSYATRQVKRVEEEKGIVAYGLPSLSNTTPFGSGAFPLAFGPAAAAACGNAFLLVVSSSFGSSSSNPGIFAGYVRILLRWRIDCSVAKSRSLSRC